MSLPMGMSVVKFYQVFENRPRWVANKKDRTATYLMVECINGHRSIVAAVIYNETRHVVRPITSRK